MEAGTASLMGQPVQRSVLVHEDKLKIIFLTYRDDALEIYVALTENPEQVAYGDIDLPETARNEMDQILASFLHYQPTE